MKNILGMASVFWDYLEWSLIFIASILIGMFIVFDFRIGPWTSALLVLICITILFLVYKDHIFVQGRDKFYTLYADPVSIRKKNSTNFLVVEPAAFAIRRPGLIKAGEVSTEFRFGDNFKISLELDGSVVEMNISWQAKLREEPGCARKNFLIADSEEGRAAKINPVITNLLTVLTTTDLDDKTYEYLSQNLATVNERLEGLAKTDRGLLGRQCDTYGIEIITFTVGDINLPSDLQKARTAKAVAAEFKKAVAEFKDGLEIEDIDAIRFVSVITDESEGLDVRGFENLGTMIGGSEALNKLIKNQKKGNN